MCVLSFTNPFFVCVFIYTIVKEGYRKLSKTCSGFHLCEGDTSDDEMEGRRDQELSRLYISLVECTFSV